MGNQGLPSTIPIGPRRQDGERRRRFQERYPAERPRDELAACSRPPAWDESGFPIAPRTGRLPARVWRLLER